jgi:hypothetical protein
MGHYGISAQIAEKLLKQASFKEEFIYNVMNIINLHENRVTDNMDATQKYIDSHGLGKDTFPVLVCLMAADAIGQEGQIYSDDPGKLNRTLMEYQMAMDCGCDYLNDKTSYCLYDNERGIADEPLGEER